MAATVTKEFLFKQMQDRPAPYFVVRGTDREEIARNQEEESPDRAIKELDAIFTDILDPYVLVTISDRTSKQRGEGGNTRKGLSEFKIQLRPTASQSINGPGASASYVDELRADNRRLLEEVQALKMDALRSDFTRKFEALKESQKEDPLTVMAIQTLAGMINKNPGAIAVHGADDAPVNQDAVNKQQRLRGALVRLAKIDPDLEQTIERIANWAEKNPAEYKTYLSLIPA